MQTKQIQDPRRTDVQPHRLGMGWHLVWRYDPPIVHQAKREDGSSFEWEEDGDTSEGCIMWKSVGEPSARTPGSPEDFHVTAPGHEARGHREADPRRETGIGIRPARDRSS